MLITDLADARPAIVGLGYVGFPLAVEFGRRYPTIGFDINQEPRRRTAPTSRLDARSQPRKNSLPHRSSRFRPTCTTLHDCNVYIVTVPTPIDVYKRPDMAALRSASKAIGEVIKRGDVVVYESTVYPGATEEVCLPIIEKISGLRLNTDFFAGYSPERINPGRQVASTDDDHEGHVRLDARSRRLRRPSVWLDRHGRYPSRVEHPRRRSREGHRKHPARSEHRADQRTDVDLRAHGHRHRRSTPGGQARNGTSCSFVRVSSAVTASASIRTI